MLARSDTIRGHTPPAASAIRPREPSDCLLRMGTCEMSGRDLFVLSEPITTGAGTTDRRMTGRLVLAAQWMATLGMVAGVGDGIYVMLVEGRYGWHDWGFIAAAVGALLYLASFPLPTSTAGGVAGQDVPG